MTLHFLQKIYTAGARQFPLIVPTSATHPSAPICWETWSLLTDCQVPLTTAFGANDDVTGSMQGLLSGRVAGAKNQPHTIIEDAGHFIQEQQPGRCVEVILSLLDRTELMLLPDPDGPSSQGEVLSVCCNCPRPRPASDWLAIIFVN